MSSVPVLRTAPHVSSTFLDRGGLLTHLSGPALSKNVIMHLGPHFLSWTGATDASAWELVEVTVYSADGRRSWPYFTQQTMLGCEGLLELNRWRATGVHRVAGHGATVSFTLRAALPTVQSFKHGASEPVVSRIDHYSTNNVLFLFPRANLPPRQLWANSEDLSSGSLYFRDMFDPTNGFMESEGLHIIPPLPSTLFSTSDEEHDGLNVFETQSEAAGDDAPGSRKSVQGEEAIGSNVVSTRVPGNKGELQTLGSQVTSRSTIDEETTEEEGEGDSDDESDSAVLGPSSTPKPIHRVIIRHTAYKTYRALLYFLITGEITFSTLQSASTPSSESSAADDLQASSALLAPLPVSPKSIYRLADQLCLLTLKELALDNYTQQLTASNVLDELFSEFSVSYAPMRDAAKVVALSFWKELAGGDGMRQLREKVARGEVSGVRMDLAFDLFTRLTPA